MSASKIFLLALCGFVALLAIWWFTPPAIRADIAKKIQPQSDSAASAQAERSGSAPLQTTVYKWKDASGQQHFSNTPPKDRKYEVVLYRNDANVVSPN